MKIEYQVRERTVYYVTRYEEDDTGGAASRGLGEYPTHDGAHDVAYALCRAEHERLGWPLDDERIQYPKGRYGQEVPLTHHGSAA